VAGNHWVGVCVTCEPLRTGFEPAVHSESKQIGGPEENCQKKFILGVECPALHL
jgi:hypothetical protein